MLVGSEVKESSNRAKYPQLSVHQTDTIRNSKSPKTPRLVDAWKPVLHLSEEEIWGMLEDWGFIAPLPYRLGWGRSSCQMCVFNSDRIMATINHYWPERLLPIAEYENEFGVTIARSGLNVIERAKKAKPIITDDAEALLHAMNSDYTLPVFLNQGQKWKLPAGAYASESSGAS